VAKLNLKNIILRSLGVKADPATYFTKYMYPRKGISVLYENMAAELRSSGSSSSIRLESPVVGLERDDDRIARVVCSTNGRAESIECDGVLSTLPLPQLIGLIAPALPASVAEHASKLRYRSLKLIYIALNRPRLTDYHWVYLLDSHFRVNRISEQKNVSADMVPADRTILCIELSCWTDEPLWRASDEEIYRIAIRDVMQMGYGVTEAEVESYHVAQIATAYPVYELDFEKHLIPVLEGVHRVRNLLTLGRHGLFLNNSMDDNVLLGMKAASHVTDGGFDSQAWLSEMLAFMNLRFDGK
jgi:protoporphyrinogen oxidase